MADTASERAELLADIAQLEAELARKSTDSDGHSTPAGVGRPNKRPRMAGGAGEGGQTGYSYRNSEPEPSERASRRAEEQIADHAQLTGIDITSSSSEVVSESLSALERMHTLSGKAGASVTFTVRLRVREPAQQAAASAEGEEEKRDPGREYVVEKMDCEVKGGGKELRDALQRTPSLTLSYTLSPSKAPTAIRLSRPLDLYLSLVAETPPDLPSAARATLDSVPQQFELMLQAGMEPSKVIEAVVQSVFRGAAS
ncbi:hypothetical protein JCM10207_001536 [Rhodosporidiobolus poonsookiae]